MKLEQQVVSLELAKQLKELEELDNLWYNRTMKKIKKIWFICLKCRKFNWVEASKHNLSYYEGVETSYCPHCDDETMCEYDVDKKPNPIFITI